MGVSFSCEIIGKYYLNAGKILQHFIKTCPKQWSHVSFLHQTSTAYFVYLQWGRQVLGHIHFCGPFGGCLDWKAKPPHVRRTSDFPQNLTYVGTFNQNNTTIIAYRLENKKWRPTWRNKANRPTLSFRLCHLYKLETDAQNILCSFRIRRFPFSIPLRWSPFN